MTYVDIDQTRVILDHIDSFLDTVPRGSGRAEDFGTLTLFVADEAAPFPYHARPARNRPNAEITAEDVTRVRERQRELGVPEIFEWLDAAAPSLRPAAEKAGLAVTERPLLVLEPSTPTPTFPEGIRILGADDPALAGALAVPHLAFAELGTHVGTASLADLPEAIRLHATAAVLERTAARIRAGQTVIAAAFGEGTGASAAGAPALCSGQLLPIGTTAEIAGVGTLPSARRRGLGGAVTAALAAEARTRGMETVFLSATDGAVARVYAACGFQHVGSALFAEPEGSAV